MVRWRHIVVLALLAAACAPAQQQPTPPPGVETPAAPQPERRKKPERKISEREARELFASVDEILKFVSQDTGLPIKHPVKRELSSREKVRKYVDDRARDDGDRERLQRAGIVLKKLGLLPRAFDLEQYLTDIHEEQVAGFYDSKTKTVYLLDWIEPEAQKAVLAHELTHALQDQNFDLEKLLKKAARAEDQSAALKSREPIAVRQEEQGTAVKAIVEGQAQIAAYDYFLAPSGHSVSDSPMLIRMARAQSEQLDAGRFPLMARAPRYLRESLMFPYTFGLEFEQKMLSRGGKQLAFAGVLARPPRNTREVMEPEAYGSDEPLPPVQLPAMRILLGEDYEPYDVGSIGQFDVYSLLKQFAGEKTADRLAPGWRGGAYYAAERTRGRSGDTDCAARPADPQALELQRVACLAMLTHTRWDSPATAAQWAQRYATLLLVKYKFAQSLSDESAKAAAEQPQRAGKRCFECQGGERWMTDEGMVVIQQRGDTVLVLESFDDLATPRLQQAILPPPATQPAAHSPQ